MASKVEYEEYLNRVYAEIATLDFLRDNFIYLTHPDRPNRITWRKILDYADKNKLGYMIKKYDPIAFNVGFNEYKRQHDKRTADKVHRGFYAETERNP